MSALFDPCGFPMNLGGSKKTQSDKPPANTPNRWLREPHDKSTSDIITSVLGNTPQADKLVHEFQRMKSGHLAYELIPPMITERTVPKEVLGNHYIIANPRPYIFMDIVGNGWTLGTCQMVPSSFDGPCFRYSGDEPTLHGEKLTYPLPTVLQSLVTEILNYTPPHNKWGSQGDTIHPANYNLAHLQPIAKLFFDNFAPVSVKRLFLLSINTDSVLPVESDITPVQEDIKETIDYIQSLWK